MWGSCPAPERFGSQAEPLANRATTARRHLCSQGAGPPPGVLRGRTTPTAEASRGSLSVPWPPPRRNAGGGAVNPHPASAGSAGPAGGKGRARRGTEGVKREARGWSALNPSVPAGQPRLAGVAGPRVPRGGYPDRAGRAGGAAGRPPIAGARRGPWEARGGRGEGGGRAGGRAASPGRSRRAARRGGRGASERAPPSPDVSSGCPRSRASGGAGGGGGGHRAPGTAAGERAGMGGAPSGPGGRAGILAASLR